MKRKTMLAAILLTVLAGPTVTGQSIIERLTIESEKLGEDRNVIVRLPAGYAGGDERYPVLYLTDGDVQIGHTISTIEFLSRQGRMPELIVVGITNTDRTRDLTPTRASMKDASGQSFPLPTSGGAETFLKFIETELVPEIEGRYRTSPYRILAGHSFGGLFTLHTMMTRPEIFNGYIAVSPTIGWDNDYLIKLGRDFFSKPMVKPLTLFFTMANEGGESQAGFKELEKLLSKKRPKGLEWGSMLMEDEDHGSTVLRSHYHGLRKVYEGWQIPLAGTLHGLKEVEAHYAGLSKKYGYDIPPPEANINTLGYQYINAGKINEAIDIFKWNVERYPNSANVYDSLGEAYEKKGRPDLAEPLYKKAAETGSITGDPNTPVYQKNYERAGTSAKKKAAGSGN